MLVTSQAIYSNKFSKMLKRFNVFHLFLLLFLPWFRKTLNKFWTEFKQILD